MGSRKHRNEVLFLKTFKKIVLTLFLIILAVVLLIFALRFYNGKRYPVTAGDPMTMNPRDLAAYPTSVEGVKIEIVNHKTFQGFHLLPEKKTHKGVVVCYGGSEGSPNFPYAEHFAKLGYESVAVFMFGMENQPKTLCDVPLEQFQDVLDYLAEKGWKDEPLTVFGGSKGAEYALNLADKYEQISNLVLIAPSAYNFAGLDFSKIGSSWTWQGKELPFVNMQKSNFSAFIKNMVVPMLIKAPVSYKETYDSAVAQDPEAETKLIPVKRTKAEILLLAGEDDQMWNSPAFAEKIREQNPEHVRVVIYPGAGHVFRGNGVIATPSMVMNVGGTQEANEKAGRESQAEIESFLSAHHGK